MIAAYKLFACRGAGSTIIEAALTLTGARFEAEYFALDQLGPDCREITPYNPLGQVPTLIAPDGSVHTECAAILMMLDDLAPEAGLVPAPGEAERAPFLRWLMLIMGSIYPTLLYGDFPDRWVPGEAAQAALVARTDRHRETLWQYLEAQTEPDPWVLGQRFSALDLCVWVMRRWRPRREWFRSNCPGLDAAADAADALAALAPVRERNFS
jgi:GST-like protein